AGVAYVLDHVVADDDVELPVRVGQHGAIDLAELVALRLDARIDDVDRVDIEVVAAFLGEDAGDDAGTAADLEQRPRRLEALRAEDADDLACLRDARGAVQRGMRLPLRLRIVGSIAGRRHSGPGLACAAR